MCRTAPGPSRNAFVREGPGAASGRGARLDITGVAAAAYGWR
jgi:hypothetical protein